MLYLDTIDALGFNQCSFPRCFGLPLFPLFSLSLWAAQRLAKSWDLSELFESGERCGTESCFSPSPGGTRYMRRVNSLQSRSLSCLRLNSQPLGCFAASWFTVRTPQFVDVSDDFLILSGNISHGARCS